MNKLIKYILFDMDGVLVESEEIMLESAKSALAEWGINAKDEDFVEFIGTGEDRFVGGVAEKHGHKYVYEMKDRAYEIYGELAKTKNIAYKNAKKLILALKDKGYRMAVCSSADRIKVEINLEALEIGPNVFEYIVSGLDVQRKKPFPDIYLLGAEKFSAKIEECIVVEDAVSGITAAKAAGMKNIAVTTSFSKEDMERLAAPDYIIDDVIKVLDILES